MMPKLQRGQALVLVGPHSSTLALAREISAMAGSWAQLELRSMITPLEFGPWLAKKVDTLIVDGVPNNAQERRAVLPYIANREAVVQMKAREQSFAPTPNFIFITGDRRPLRFVESDRRFFVRRLEGAHS